MTDKEREKIEEYDLEAAMRRLDEVSEALARENVGLEVSMALYEEGVALVRHCERLLSAVERRISIIKTSSDGEVVQKSFDTQDM